MLMILLLMIEDMILNRTYTQHLALQLPAIAVGDLKLFQYLPVGELVQENG
jgi:hypothetical protein